MLVVFRTSRQVNILGVLRVYIEYICNTSDKLNEDDHFNRHLFTESSS